MQTVRLARDLGADGIVVLNLSGRGDKDVDEIARVLGMVAAGGGSGDGEASP